MEKSEWVDVIAKLVDSCVGQESRLNLLTSIGIETSEHEVFMACEEIRNEIVESDKEVPQGREELLHCERHCDHCNDRGTIESNEVDGE